MVVRIEDFINGSGVQESPDVLVRHEVDDDVIYFAGWGYFSLTKGRFLPIGTNPVGKGELDGLQRG